MYRVPWMYRISDFILPKIICVETEGMVLIVPSLIHVLVIAHPDDESMFFLPWIYYTTQQQQHDPSITSSAVWLLCLTTGDYDGLGKIRSQELHDFNKNVLHRNGFQKVIILDEPDIIPDHPKQRWNISRTTEQIHSALRNALDVEYGGDSKHPATMSFVTFDQRGVSGHVNHVDTYDAVRHLYQQQLQILQSLLTSSTVAMPRGLLASETVEVWVLQSIQNPITKYIPIAEWIRLMLHSVLRWYPNSDTYTIQKNCQMESTYRLLQPSLNWYAMSTHRSQFVWYRRLFVIFSIYTYKNTFHKLIPIDSNPKGSRHQEGDNTNKEF